MPHITHPAIDADKWLVGVDDWLAEIAALEAQAVEAELVLPPVPPAHTYLADVQPVQCSPPVQRLPLGPPVRIRLPPVPPVWRHLPLVAPLVTLMPCASFVRASCAFMSSSGPE